MLEPDDLVWVHDYHLIPLAKPLRERGHKNRIGFFLHIPCPPPEDPYRVAGTTSVLFPRFANTISWGSKLAMMPSTSAVISPENAACTAMISISSSPIGQSESTYSRLASKLRLSPIFPGVQVQLPFVKRRDQEPKWPGPHHRGRSLGLLERDRSIAFRHSSCSSRRSLTGGAK